MINKLREFFSLTSEEIKITVVVLLIAAGFTLAFLIWLHAVINSIGN